MAPRPKQKNIVQILTLAVLFSFFTSSLAEIFFEERFEDGWQSRWVRSDWKRNEGKAGSFKHTAVKWPGDPDDKGFISLTL
ncbi:calreticulin-3 [Olea europaea subsp. europaea]|nr:calreticulin-3 [Olea europaea subsp. europaea]